MSRTIHADVITEIAKDSFSQVALIYLAFDTAIYITNAFHDIVYDGNTYLAGGHLLKSGAIQESSDVRVGTLNITLSGVDQSYISILLNQSTTNRQIKVYRAFLDSSQAIIGDPLLTFDGRVSDFKIKDARDSSTITLSSSSHWADFEKKAGRRTNNNSQQMFFDGDLGFEYAANITKDIKWGRT